jgi:superfamily II DNA/RNA helicase
MIKFIEASREEEKKSGLRQHGLMIIFVNKIATIGFLLELLRKHISADAFACVGQLHGRLQQAQRETVLASFKAVRLTD